MVEGVLEMEETAASGCLDTPTKTSLTGKTDELAVVLLPFTEAFNLGLSDCIFI